MRVSVIPRELWLPATRLWGRNGTITEVEAFLGESGAEFARSTLAALMRRNRLWFPPKTRAQMNQSITRTWSRKR